MLWREFVLTLFLFTTINGDSDVNINSCTYKGGESGQTIKGYFWRDYDGLIPDDAYQMSPQRFIGLAYDSSSTDLYIGTIFEGRKFVYIARNGSVRKIDLLIKILCTHEPQSIESYHTRNSNSTLFDVPILIEGGHSYLNDSVYPMYLGVTKGKDGFHAFSVVSFGDPSEYVTKSGVIKTIKQYAVLAIRFHQSTQSSSNRACATGAKQSKYRLPPSHAAMNYFWVSTPFFSEDYAFLVGHGPNGEKLYLAQSSLQDTGLGAGETQYGERNRISMVDYVSITYFDVHTFSTLTPEKFNWTASATRYFHEVTRKEELTFIHGGLLPNGTRVYLGRVHDEIKTAPASIRIFGKFAYGYFVDGEIPGVSETFGFLTYVG